MFTSDITAVLHHCWMDYVIDVICTGYDGCYVTNSGNCYCGNNNT